VCEGREVFGAVGGYETREVIGEKIGVRALDCCEEIGWRVGYFDRNFEGCIGRETEG